MGRTITGTLLNIDGLPMAGVDVLFTLIDAFFATATDTYPRSTGSATTDVNGDFTIDLAVLAAGDLNYRCTLPSGESFDFVFADGAATTLEDIIAAGVSPPATLPILYLRADGSVDGANSGAQDFGANGIKADLIVESTGSSGTTIEGVLIKDAIIARSGIPWGKNTLVVGGQGLGSYSYLSTALAAITDAAADNPYTILVVGIVAESAPIVAKSYVNVQGLAGAVVKVQNNAPGQAVLFTSVVSSEWRDLLIQNLGASATKGIELVLTDTTVALRNLTVTTAGAADAVKLTSGTVTAENVKGASVTADTMGNSPSGKYSFIFGGFGNSIPDDDDVYGTVIVGGGQNTVTQGRYSAILGGHSNTVDVGQAAVIAGGESNQALGAGSAVLGGLEAKASHVGEIAQATGKFAAVGDAQTTTMILRGTTANATPDNLTTGGAADDGILLPYTAYGAVWKYHVEIAVCDIGATVAGGFEISGAFLQAVETPVTLGAPVKTAWETDAGLDANVTLDANTMNVTVTGLAATNLRWVAFVRLVQVSFPA